MQALLFGLAAILLGFVALRTYTQIDPAKLAKGLRIALGAAALGLALWQLVRGSIVSAMPFAMAGLWLISGSKLPRTGSWPGGAPSSGPGTSRIATDHLEMELDLENGEMRGRILKGFFAGRRIESLRPVELAHLWQDCRFVDPKSAQLVEAYLDRLHPSWREDLQRAEEASPRAADGRMPREEALEILGLGPSPTPDEIRRAHRELMLKLHPDRGGSTYLAAKVNEAKAVLLDGEEA